MDHKSILSIHVIYEYVYMLQASLAGFPLFFISKASYTILLHLFFSHYLFQMEHELAKFVFQSIPANIEMNANVKSLQSDFFNSIVFNTILDIQNSIKTEFKTGFETMMN